MVVAFSARSRLLVYLHLLFIIHKSRVQIFPDAETVRNEYFVSSDQYMCLTNFVVPFSPCHGVTLQLCRTGFNFSKFPLVKWSKHGQTTLVIPGHDPPHDITVFMDVAVNPGPRIGSTSIDELHFINVM